MALSSNKLNVLPVICITILTICWQAHAPEPEPLSEFIATKLEHIEAIEKLDFSKIPEHENVTKLIRILKEMKTINHSGTDLENVKRAQSIWHEADAIFQQFNLTGNGPHAKSNEELVTELKSLVNEIDSKSESDIVAKENKLRATFSAFKQKLTLSSKAVSATGIPKGNAPGQSIQSGAEKAQPEINESELKKGLAVALEAFSGYIDSYFTKTIESLKKDSANPRRRPKRDLFSKIQRFVNISLALIVWIIVLIVWGALCICSGVGPILWAYFQLSHGGFVCTTIGRDLTLVFLGRTQHG